MKNNHLSKEGQCKR